MRQKSLFIINSSTHSCNVCVHREYCGVDEETLIDAIQNRNMGSAILYKESGKLLIPLPSSCPILTNEIKREKVIFT